jgi:type IV pilus assembly protein PilO
MKRLSALQWHFVVVTLLLVVNLFLLVRLAVAWTQSGSEQQDRIAQQRTALKAAQLQTAPLRGLDVLVGRASSASAAFYQTRIPATYSAVAGELGKLANEQKVRLTRVQYTEAPPDQGLVEVRIDANLTGDYAALVRMISSLERDKIFFIINGLTFTGQQTGTVSLRMRVTTYLRPGATGDIPVEQAAAATETEGQ